MDDLKLSSITESDLKQISVWDKQFRNTDGYKAIKKYILENDNAFRLTTLIDAYHDKIPIGKNEMGKVIVAKNQSDDVVGFIIADIFDVQTPKSSLYLHYVVVHPLLQNQGLGKQMILKLIDEFDKIFSSKNAQNVFANISTENTASLKMFKNLGFEKTDFSTKSFLQTTTPFEKLAEYSKQQERNA